MRLWKRLLHYVTPTRENAYRPHLLGRTSLVLFLALTLAVEGFLVADLAAQQTDGTFISAVAASAPQGKYQSMGQTLERQFLRVLDDPAEATNAVLGAIAVALFVLVVLAFLIHIDVQSHEALLGGVVVAAVAFLCLMANMQLLPRGAQSAGVGTTPLAAPVPSQ